MELIAINKQQNINTSLSDGTLESSEDLKKLSKEEIKGLNPFIEANTKNVTLSELSDKCIIPVFAKDNEKTIAHQEFIEITKECVKTSFHHQEKIMPEIRVSHEIKGRIPEAI